jgi:plasmid stability protein
VSTRTTLTLDDDVAARLDAEARRTGTAMKQLVNELLRHALSARKRPERRPFTVQARPLGLRPGLGYDSIGDLLEAVEGPAHR